MVTLCPAYASKRLVFYAAFWSAQHASSDYVISVSGLACFPSRELIRPAILTTPSRLRAFNSFQSSLREWYPRPSPAIRSADGREIVQLEAKQVFACENTLGEAPMFHPTEKALYWLDINGKKLHKFKPSSTLTVPVAGAWQTQEWDLPEIAGSFAFTKEQDLFLMGFTSGLSFWVASTGEVEKICDFEPGLNTRPNDAKCDRTGNFIIGGYNNNHREDKLNITGLWRLSKKTLELEEILDYKFRCSNTVAFSPAGDDMYFCDTPTREIFKFKYSEAGKLTDRQDFYRMAADDEGGPDGATVDSEGGLWEAQAGNWRVVRHRPLDGAIDYEVQLPFNNPTSVAIGGNVLFITTARHRLSEDERAAQPGAGQLWAVQLPSHLRGVAEPVFAGHRRGDVQTEKMGPR